MLTQDRFISLLKEVIRQGHLGEIEEGRWRDSYPNARRGLKGIIQKIEVDKDGNVDIFLRILVDLGLDHTVLIRHDHIYR